MVANARRFYLTDHLGSTRAVVDDAGNVLETFDYYPFGLLMPKRNTASANTTEKFSGKELDENTNQYYFGARYLDPALARFFVPDRFAEKYPSMTPYQYAANNPMNFIDVNGDSIDVSQLTAEQQQTLIGDLASITGYDPVQFEVSNGMLVINTSADASDGTVLEFAPPVGGSEKARTFVNAMIGFSPTEHQLGSNFVLTAGQKSTEDGTLLFNRPNAHNVDPAAWNVGMSFIHEAWHFARGFVFGSNTYSSLQNSFGAVGGIDPQRGTQSFRRGDTGPTVNFVNQIRSELGLNQRASYRGFQIGNTAYVPFDQASKRSLLRGLVPANSSSYFYK